MDVKKININQSEHAYGIASDIYDVSAHNNGAIFESLSALLTDENLSILIPTALRCGGMSIRFIQSSDNKYVQYRLMTNVFSTTVSDWQGVDDEPTVGSDNLVKSGGIADAITTEKKRAETAERANAKAITDKKDEVIKYAENISKSLQQIAEKTYSTTITKEDGLLILDLLGEIGVQIGSLLYWEKAPYNKKYGWGGHPYGEGTLPPFSRVVGVLEADMLSVRGGKGRWNGEDTGNFQHGGHVFEGWNKEEDVRLTAGIGLKNKNVGWLQTFHPATLEDTDSGAYYGITQIGSDIEGYGVAFMPNVWHMKKPYNEMDLNWGPNMSTSIKNDIKKMIECGIMSSSEYNPDKKGYKGQFYYDYGDKAIKLFDGSVWHTFKETSDAEFRAYLTTASKEGYNLDNTIAIAHKAYSCTITAKEGYELPETIVAVKSLYIDVPYIWNKETGALSVEGEYVEGYIEIHIV